MGRSSVQGEAVYDQVNGSEPSIDKAEANLGAVEPVVHWGRRFPRPLALAHTRLELPFAAISVLVLLGLFLGDLWEPPQIVVGVLDLFPILAAVWLASGRIAAVICVTAFVLLVLTGVTRVVNWQTVAAELTTYLIIAVLARLYARNLVDLLEVRRRRARPGQRLDQGVTLAALSNDPPAGLTTLSQREREVAILAAQGYTAREIGEHLFIGERTVETHLAHVYAKLGISSRLELVRMASKLG
jgi:DNA-binding CsgD family transcriptional regulator